MAPGALSRPAAAATDPVRVLLVSDNRYYRDRDRVRVDFRFPVELPDRFPFPTLLVCLGNLLPVTDPAALTEVAATSVRFVDAGGFPTRPAWVRNLPRSLPALWREIGRADLVIAKLLCLNGLAAIPIAMARRRRLVVMLVGDPAEAVRWRFQSSPIRAAIGSRAAGHLTRACVRAATLTWAVSPALADRYARRSRVVVASESTVLEAGVVARPRQGPAAARLLYVGRLEAVKNVDCLLRAVVRLAATPGLHLTVVGAGSQAARLRTAVGQLGLGEIVEFRGHVTGRPELAALYDSHDLLVLPSLSEGLPLVLLEAMARGLPCIASAVGGVPGLLDAGGGLLFAPNDDRQLAGAVATVLADRALYERLSSAGRDTAVAHSLEREQQKAAGALAGAIS